VPGPWSVRRDVVAGLVLLAALIGGVIGGGCAGGTVPAPTETTSATAEVTATPSTTARATGTARAATVITPTAIATPLATPVPQRAPTFAPDGRTERSVLDAFIELVLNGDADALAGLYDGVGRRYCTDARGIGEDRDLAATEWPALLGAAERTLYAVSHGDLTASPLTDFDVVLAVTADGATEGWAFGIERGAVVDLRVGCGTAPRSYTPDVSFQFDRFLVLPPIDALPQAPPAHPASVRTETAADAILEAIEGGDGAALVALVQYEPIRCSTRPDAQLPCAGSERAGVSVDVLPQLTCSNREFLRRRGFVEERLAGLADPGTTVHAVIAVPQQYLSVEADLEVILVRAGERPYSWQAEALFLRDGRVVAWNVGCGDNTAQLYPPRAYLHPPRSGEFRGRSGVAVIDTVLEAFAAQDVAALEAAVDWQLLGCLEPGVGLGIGQPPYCEDDEEPGTLIETFGFSACEGGPVRRVDAMGGLANLLALDWSVYAIADLGVPQFDWQTRYQVVLRGALTQDLPALSLAISEAGLRQVRTPCGPGQPADLFWPGNTPEFVLAPAATAD